MTTGGTAMTHDSPDPLAHFRPRTPGALPRPTPLPTRLLAALRELVNTPTADAELMPEQVGPYRLIRERGRGGMGVVYEADDSTLGRRVAVKVLSTGVYSAQAARERFAREVRAAAAVRHDHLVPVYAAETPPGGPPYLVMPLIAGPTLAERVRETAGLPPAAAAGYARQLADALTALHTAGVIHRDVKPGNVLIDAADGRAKLTDFGLARSGDTTATTLDGLAGTPAYLSPEQIARPQSADARADVYALGVTLYEMLTGVPPFRGSLLDLLRLVVEQDPVPPRQLNRGVPLDLQTVCLMCLAKEPAHRYPSAASLRDDLDRFLAGRPVVARPVGRLARGWRWCRRSPVLAAVSFTLGAAIVGGVTTTAMLWQRAEANAQTARVRQREAEEAAGREAREREAAEANLAAALTVVDQFCVRVSEEELLKVPGAELVRKKLLTDALTHYKRFVASNRDDPRAARAVANAQDRLSVLLLSLGEVGEATAAREAALAAHKALGDPPAVAEDWLLLSDCHFAANRMPDALAAGAEAVRRFAALPDPSPRFVRRHAEALLAAARAELLSNTPGSLERYAEAVRLLEPLADSDADAKKLLATSLSSLATARMTQEDVPTLERVRRLLTELLTASPDSPELQFYLAQSNNNLGVLHKWCERIPEAVDAYSAAAAGLERLTADRPKVVVWRRTLARTRFNLFELYAQRGQEKECLQELRAACGHFDLLAAGRAPEPRLALETGTAHAQLALRLVPADRPAAVAELDRVTALVAVLHAVPDFNTVLNERLTVNLVRPGVSGWLAVGDPVAARKLVADHAAYQKACGPSRVSDVARKAFFRVRVEATRADGPDALLAVVNDWAGAYPTDADELAEAGRACVTTAAGGRVTDACGERARELFTAAAKLGWKPPPAWTTDRTLSGFFR